MENETSTSTKWLKPARLITASIYIFLLLVYLVFLIVCIVIYPRCERAAETPWWSNTVFLRFSSRTMKFDSMSERLTEYKTNFGAQAIWLQPIFSLSNEMNPLDWKEIDEKLGNANELNDFIDKAHRNDLRILVDYPLNHFSLQSSFFLSNPDDFFVWNDRGNTSNWKTVDNPEESAWRATNSSNRSFYLHQFSNEDSIDLNYRNNRVLNELIDSIDFWNKNFPIDGFNLQGISYAYEDYQLRNETNSNSRTRHLEEDFLLLARLRSAIDENKILLFDSVDSLATKNDEEVFSRYFGDCRGVQLASIDDFIVRDEFPLNLTSLFDRFYHSKFHRDQHPLIWSSRSLNSRVNEAFFAVALFHIGAISIDFDREGQEMTRLGQLMKLTRTLDVFRVGLLEQKILHNGNWLTIERSRRGSKHHLIIVNFSDRTGEEKIQLKNGMTNTVEVLLTNIADPGSRYEINALIDLSEPVELRSFEYLILRWAPSIDGLGISF